MSCLAAARIYPGPVCKVVSGYLHGGRLPPHGSRRLPYQEAFDDQARMPAHIRVKLSAPAGQPNAIEDPWQAVRDNLSR